MSSPISPQLVYALKAVSGPALSPDGKPLVFARGQVDAESMESRSQLMVVRELPGGPARPFTQGKRDANPQFSPDGRWVAFFRGDENNRRQLWLIPSDGGEARALYAPPGGVSDFKWAPDSQRLAALAKVDPDQLPEDHDPKADPRVKVVTRIRYRFDTLGWIGDAHNHLFVVDLDGAANQVTDGDWDDAAPAWSPDGARLAFVSAREDDREFTFRSQVYVVDAAGGAPEPWSEGLSSVTSPNWSPDGKRLAVVGSTDDEAAVFWNGELYPLEPGKAPERLTDDSIHPNTGFGPIVPPPEIRWTADGRLLFLGDARGESYLFELTLADGALRRVAGGGQQLGAVSFDGATARAAVFAVPPTSAGDLHLVEVGSGDTAQLTEENRDYFEKHPAARLEKFELERAGMTIQSRVWSSTSTAGRTARSTTRSTPGSR